MYQCRNRRSKTTYLNKKQVEYEAMLPKTRNPVATLKSTAGSKNLTVLYIRSSHISKGVDFIKNSFEVIFCLYNQKIILT
jgi:hypothetical protein